MNMPTNYRILITGANGLLGQKLVRQLIRHADCEILATGKGRSRLPSVWSGFRYMEMDHTSPKAIGEIFRQFQPTTVIHAGAMTQVDDCEVNQAECYKQNVEATSLILKACQSIDAHLIFVSTDFIFGGEDGPYTEEATGNPVNYYGSSKLLAEKAIMNSSLSKWSIVRTVLVYGISHDMSRSNLILWVKSSLEAGKTIQVVDDQFRSPTLAEDLADGIIKIAMVKAYGIFNVSGPDRITPYQMAVLTAKYFGLDQSCIVNVPSSSLEHKGKRPLKTGLIIDKAIRELDFRPKSFTEGIGILAKQLKLAHSYKN
ncbi:SDR family oxidoreductase [Anditalea andensis]|uniref:dTDP-4-dehydrorhamnose reductase n=1 Tax=Anditalea andensis TaxID=1048983 RepID=A0A074KYM3_9BACT|nr:SDR family oxidoreductase [Anditalea andensis]KEO73325.1 dTDP-4-dehydrorhamnose reductase [Anditalea andensis]